MWPYELNMEVKGVCQKTLINFISMKGTRVFSTCLWNPLVKKQCFWQDPSFVFKILFFASINLILVLKLKTSVFLRGGPVLTGGGNSFFFSDFHETSGEPL